MTHDTINTLGEVTIPRADKNVITSLLQLQGQRQSITDITGVVNENESIAYRNKPTAEEVSRSSIATLTPGVWINNEVIHYMGRILVALDQSMSQIKVHVYPTFFMSRLHNEGAGGRGYNFEAVRNNDSRIEGGPRSLDKLYIPINVNNTHWNFIRVTITNKTIQPFDSQGVNAENNKYLQATENYMYKALTKNQRGERQDFSIRKQG